MCIFGSDFAAPGGAAVHAAAPGNLKKTWFCLTGFDVKAGCSSIGTQVGCFRVQLLSTAENQVQVLALERFPAQHG